MTAGREELAALLLAERDAAQQELAALTPRQREVLTLTAKGYTQQEAGARLGVARKTIESLLYEVRARLDMSMAEVIVLAARAGWV